MRGAFDREDLVGNYRVGLGEQKTINNLRAIARQFKEKLAALQFEFDESERNQASAVSPACPKPFDGTRTKPSALNLQVLRELDEIIGTRPSPPVNFRLWLETRRAHYIAWLTRL